MAGRFPSSRVPWWRRLVAFSFDRRVILGATAMLFVGLGLMLAVLGAPLPAWVHNVAFVAMWLCLGSSLAWVCLVLCALSVLFVARIIHDVALTLDVLRHSLPPRGATLQQHRQ